MGFFSYFICDSIVQQYDTLTYTYMLASKI